MIGVIGLRGGGKGRVGSCRPKVVKTRDGKKGPWKVKCQVGKKP